MRISDWSSYVCYSDLAEAVLRATPDTPIERLIGKKAIEANSFLRGKTAGDVIEWASTKMGGDHGAPTLRRDLFDSDEEYAAAQRAVDDDELSRLASRGDVEAEIGRASCRERVCQYV